MTELEVKLSADIKSLKDELNRAKKLLGDFGNDTDKQGKKAQGGFKAAGKGAANATQTLQEFSRVIQDAPFGIQGVANNITQLVSNFENLQRSTGGGSAAFKALLGSLTGPGGVLLAVSALTSLFVGLAQSGTTLSDVLNFITGDVSELEKATRALNEAQREGVSTAKSEITVLNTLLEISRDETRSKEERQRAINKINKEYGDLLPNLNLENINTQKVTKAVDNLTKSLIREAQIRGAQSLIAKETEKILELQQKSAIDTASAWDVLTSSLLGYQNGTVGINLVTKGVQRQNKELEEAQKRIDGFVNTLKELISEDIELGGSFTNIDIKPEKFKNNFKDLDDIFGIENAAQKSLENIKGITDNFDLVLDNLGNVISFSLKDSLEKSTPYFAEWEQRLREFSEDAGRILEQGFENALSGIGRAIGESLVTGQNVFSSIGQVLLQTLGQIAVQLGEAAIGIGVAMLAIKASFSNPFTAIAAGVALVALGSALGAIANSAVQGPSGGGGFGTSSVAGQSQQGGRISNGTGSFGASVNNSGTVVFEISGQKLVGVLNRTLGENGRLGGNLSLG